MSFLFIGAVLPNPLFSGDITMILYHFQQLFSLPLKTKSPNIKTSRAGHTDTLYAMACFFLWGAQHPVPNGAKCAERSYPQAASCTDTPAMFLTFRAVYRKVDRKGVSMKFLWKKVSCSWFLIPSDISEWGSETYPCIGKASFCISKSKSKHLFEVR